jgi:hypothetical protein
MRKRERENPCGICGHYHKYELGEVCGVCGHRPPASAGAQAAAGAAQAGAADGGEGGGVGRDRNPPTVVWCGFTSYQVTIASDSPVLILP